MAIVGRKGNVGANLEVGYVLVNILTVGGSLYLYGSASISRTLAIAISISGM
jgi:hypothetical protein